jgi:hypothetical protein
VYEELDRIKLAQKGDQWRALTSMIMNLRVSQQARSFLNIMNKNRQINVTRARSLYDNRDYCNSYGKE